MYPRLIAILVICGIAPLVHAQSDSRSLAIQRCEVVPVADKQVSFRIDGIEKFKWNFGDTYPRPYFYPFLGPSGAELTRMGHPGAPDHDHHQSIWFANNKVNGLNFWGNGTNTSIRQKQWYAYEDGNNEAIMASLLGWYASDGSEVMTQELVAAIVPMTDGEYCLEMQITMRSPVDGQPVELEQTNFGFLAIRVAKTISARFGGGVLTNSEGQVGEQETFAKSARWMDYSGPVTVGLGSDRTIVTEGITLFDHPSNLNYPTPWHVRDDGWMGAAVNLHQGMIVTEEKPLTLRYLLHSHRGVYDQAKAEAVHQEFAKRSGFVISKGTRPHYQYEVRRVSH